MAGHSSPAPQRRWVALVGSLVAFLLLGAVVATPVSAATADETDPSATDLTWSMVPASAQGPDGRSWADLEVEPGTATTEHLALRNHSEVPVTFRLAAADGYFTDDGFFNMLPDHVPSTGAGTWVSTPGNVEVAAGQTVTVPYTVTVPVNATPGDHAAGVAASVLSLREGQDGNSVSVNSRVGFRVHLRVPGELAPQAQVTIDSAEHHLSWNPFTPGRVSVRATVVNTGNTRLSGEIVASAQGVEVRVGGTEDPVELLPGGTRTVEIDLPGTWPTALLPVQVDAVLRSAGTDGSWSTIDPVTESRTLWAMPWPQLLLLLGLGLIVVALTAGRTRRRRELDRQVEQAREEGRREAAHTSARAG